MSGCFLFLQRLTNRRRGQHMTSLGGASGGSVECGLSRPLQPLQSAQLCCCSCGSHGAAAPCSLHAVDVVCSPASSSDGEGGFSTCSSSGASCSYYRRASSSSLGGYATSYSSGGFGSGGAPSPTGHVCSPGSPGGDTQRQLVQAACEIVLMEHQLDTSEYCLFIHKRLRPIKTRPGDKGPAEKPGLLRDLITKSFTYQADPDLAQQLAAGMRAVAGGASSESAASSITFNAAAAYACCTEG